MRTKPSLHFVLTGGTIDSFYDGMKDTVVPLARSCVPDFVKSLRLSDKIVFTELELKDSRAARQAADGKVVFSEICMKDSRAMAEQDFEKMAQVIENSQCKKIIITHGTYAMARSAQYLNKHLIRRDQTIVYTGSLVPLSNFAASDAAFNIGFAVAMVSTLPPGIFVCMNGRTLAPEEVVKTLYEEQRV